MVARGERRLNAAGSKCGRTVACRAMWEIILAGGPVMWPIILCSVVAAAIVLERLWTLQRKRVIPHELTDRIWKLVESQTLNERHIEALANNSPLGRVLAAGLANRDQGREIMKEAIEDTGRHVVHELERFLGTLGTIAAVSPLLGLLGTVTGMIQAFEAISAEGVGDPQVLAGGIGTALITTAAGLIVAIPALFCYRYLRGVVDLLVVDMEKAAMKLVRAFDQMQKRAERGSRRREAAS
jgi:biopolymer transport protein ExbB